MPPVGTMMALAMLATAGCAVSAASGSPASAHDRFGQAQGRMMQIGGPPLPNGGTPKQPVSGWVRVRHHGHVVEAVKASKNGGFDIPLMPGNYRLLGYAHLRSSRPMCLPSKRIAVHASGTTSARITCEVP
jgi:hypothetical protein